MERRGTDRIRRRVPCIFQYEEQAHEALVVDVSAGGLFLQTELGLALGALLTLQLRDPACGDIEVRGRVVRRRFTPAVIARWIRRGVGVEILAAPERYRELLSGGEPVPDAAWRALQEPAAPCEAAAPAGGMTLDIAVDAAPVSPAEPEPDAESQAEPELAPPLEIAAEASLAQPEPEPEAEPEPPAQPDDAEPLAFDPTPPSELEVAVPEEAAPEPPLARADALLIHDGDLADVETLLQQMGADTVRQSTIEPRGFTGWERPPRVIVASGRSALRLSIGTNVEGQGIVTIAVVDSESQTLCGMLRRQGFRYVVRRPVHPEALRLLLGRSLFRGRERRENARVSLGCEVALRYGLRRKPATLLELSRTGCRMLLPEWPEAGARLSVRIPADVTGNRPLVLAGRVLRSDRQQRPSGGSEVFAALRFDRLDPADRARLDALIAAHSLGPTPLERVPGELRPVTGELRSAGELRPASEPRPAREAKPASEPPGPAVVEPPPAPLPPPAPASAEPSDRRRGPRAPHRREVVALEPELARVRHTLLGIDLSEGGIRVEPHPDLTLGDGVRIAIYDAAAGETLVIDAEVVRDQGARGLVLHFSGLSDDTRLRVERIVESAPQIESAGAEEGAGVVVAEMLASQPA